MRVDLPRTVARLGEKGEEIFAVGGAVRDALLGREPSDWDLTGPSVPEELRLAGAEIEDAVNGLGTAAVYWEGTRYEYTAYRTDSYGRDGDHRPAGVIFTRDMRADALRRDFTINALYARLPDGEILDPLGKGLRDLKTGTIRMTRRETMAEDPLRILRMARFAAAYGFEVEAETWSAARAAAPLLSRLSGERVLAEMRGILLGDTVFGKADAVRRGLYMLRDLNAFEYAMPELERGRGVKQSPKYHRFDVLDHQIETCAAAPADIVTRLAALLHDVAKPVVLARDGNMHAHAAEGAAMARQILRGLGASASLTGDVCGLVGEHMFDLDNRAGKKPALRRVNRLGREQFERLADLREADFAGSGMGAEAKSARKWREMLKEMDARQSPFSVKELAVNGDDLMRELDLEPGPIIGEALRQLLEYAQMRPARNNYKSLLKYAKIWLTGRRGACRSSSETD